MNEKDARKRVKELKEYYSHLASYISVNLFLIILNLILTPQFFWALFSLLGWGIGLFSHTVKVFGLFGLGGQDWETQKVKELMGYGGSKADIDRLTQRLQNIETIVADEDWEKIDPELEQETQKQTQKDRKTKMELLTDRMQNLEAIVTSSDWDKLKSDAQPQQTQEADLSSEQQVARIAKQAQ